MYSQYLLYGNRDLTSGNTFIKFVETLINVCCDLWRQNTWNTSVCISKWKSQKESPTLFTCITLLAYHWTKINQLCLKTNNKLSQIIMRQFKEQSSLTWYGSGQEWIPESFSLLCFKNMTTHRYYHHGEDATLKSLEVFLCKLSYWDVCCLVWRLI